MRENIHSKRDPVVLQSHKLRVNADLFKGTSDLFNTVVIRFWAGGSALSRVCRLQKAGQCCENDQTTHYAID